MLDMDRSMMVMHVCEIVRGCIRARNPLELSIPGIKVEVKNERPVKIVAIFTDDEIQQRVCQRLKDVGSPERESNTFTWTVPLT